MLDVKGQRLTQSLAIARYVARTFGTDVNILTFNVDQNYIFQRILFIKILFAHECVDRCVPVYM